jgi:hypothetical protein
MTEVVNLKGERLKRAVLGTPEQRARREAMERDIFNTVERHIPHCSRFAIIEILAHAIVCLRHLKSSSDEVSAQDVLELLELFEETGQWENDHV